MSNLASIKKGDVVVLLGFTGIRLADMKVTASDKSSITLIKRDGSEMVFSRKTGKQTNVEEGKEKYANKIVDPDDAPAPKAKKKAVPAGKTKKGAKNTPVQEDEDEDEVPVVKTKKKPPVDEDEDEEEDDPPVKNKKGVAKDTSKKKKPVVVDDEDDFEDV